LKFGKPLGPAIHQLITIVVPETFARWVRESKQEAVSNSSARPSQKAAGAAQADSQDRPGD
jgi:hypothetical protein